MARRDKRKKTLRKNTLRKNTLRKNTLRKNKRRVNRKNTLRKNSRRVNRKNTRRVNRKNNRKNNLRKNKLFGGVKHPESVIHCQGYLDRDEGIPGGPGQGQQAFRYAGCPPENKDRGQHVYFIIQDKSSGTPEYKLATYHGFNKNFIGANEYTFQVGQDSELETYTFKNSDIYKSCVITWTDYNKCQNANKSLAETFRQYTGDDEPVLKAAIGDLMRQQEVVARFQPVPSAEVYSTWGNV